MIAAGEPTCADWYAQCGAGNYGIFALQTLPSPFVLADGEFRATPLVTGEPTVEPGPPQRVTYRINPQAVWSDGTPITSSDFKYSWEQGRGNNVRGLGDIGEVDDTDPKTAVVTWKEPKANWRERFRPVLPKHLLDGKDRNAEMKDGYRFSGGPWMLDHWTRGQEIKWVRNPRYWGEAPYLDAVVSRVLPDPSAAVAAYKSGQIDGLTGAGAEQSVADLRTFPDTSFDVRPNLLFVFIAFNTQSPPLDRKAVRQALGYATDRDVVTTQLQGHIRPGVRPLQALALEANSVAAGEPFKRYRRDLARVSELMRSDGWSKGTDGVWARDDMRAKVELTIEAGPQFHALFGQLIDSQWREAGFDVTVKPVPIAVINGEVLPKGTYQAALTGGAGVHSNDLGLCGRVCSRNIPTEANRFVGSNIFRITNPTLDDIWGRVDVELDPMRRLDLVKRGQEMLADEVPALPTVNALDAFAFNSRKVGGPLSVIPAYTRLSEWFCKTTCG